MKSTEERHQRLEAVHEIHMLREGGKRKYWHYDLYGVFYFLYDNSGVEVENSDWATDSIKSLILDKDFEHRFWNKVRSENR